MLEIRKLVAGYGPSSVLREVDLSVPAGQVTALLGRNGMGKTTLIRAIMGLTPPEVGGGSITYNGHELVGKKPHQISALGLALVPQGRRLFASLTVMEHLRVFASNKQNMPPGDIWSVERVFELFPRLSERKQHLGSQLSGGERQMLAIARALMLNPRLLLMDEPTEGLAPVVVKHVESFVAKLSATGLPILLVEQNLHSALAVAHNIYIMETGSIVHSAPASELKADSNTLRRFLGV